MLVSIIILTIFGGAAGAVANGLMLFAMYRSGSWKREGCILIMNQMTVDLFCCVAEVVSFSLKFFPVDYKSSSVGVFMCKVFSSDSIVWTLLNCSTANLVLLTLERYAKIVHPMFHRKRFRHWMYYVVVAFSWLYIPSWLNFTVNLLTTVVVGGVCMNYYRWPSARLSVAFAVWNLVISFVVPLVTFVFCYSSILIVCRKKMKVASVTGDDRLKVANDQKTLRIQMSVIKTFLIIAVFFILCWLPNRGFFFLFNLRVLADLKTDSRNVIVFVAFLNVTINPFIYAVALDPVKKYLRLHKCCRRQRIHSTPTHTITTTNTNCEL